MDKIFNRKEHDVDELAERLNDVLHRQFIPASSPSQADDMLTTDQLFFMVDNHAPGIIPKELIRELLVALQFKEHKLGSELVWLVASPK